MKLNNGKTALILGVLLCLVFTFTAFLNYKSREEKLDLERANNLREEMRLIGRKSELQECTVEAWDRYSATWDGECLSRGMGEGCILPLYAAEATNGVLKNDKDNCIKLYGD